MFELVALEVSKLFSERSFIFQDIGCLVLSRGRSRAAATSKMEYFVIIVDGFQPLTIITERFILEIAAALDPSVLCNFKFFGNHSATQFSLLSLI